MRSDMLNKHLATELLQLCNGPLHSFGIHVHCNTDCCKVGEQEKHLGGIGAETQTDMCNSQYAHDTNTLDTHTLNTSDTSPTDDNTPGYIAESRFWEDVVNEEDVYTSAS